MKVALTCDTLIERNHEVEMIELLCSVFEEAEIFTLAHAPGKILGPIEMRKIHSSFLSHMVTDTKTWAKWSSLAPFAAQSLTIPCSFDLIINISSGFSHNISKCKKTKLFSYIYSFHPEEKAKGFLSKILRPNLIHGKWKGLSKTDELWVSSLSLKAVIKSKVERENLAVLSPFFKVDDFPLSEVSEKSDDKYIVLGVKNAHNPTLRHWLKILSRRQQKIIAVGECENEIELNREFPLIEFWGNRCNGELAPLLAGCTQFIDLSRDDFPHFSLSALAVGKEVWCFNDQAHRDFLRGEGVHFLDAIVDENSFDFHSKNFEPQALRKNALRYNPQRFKSEVRRQAHKLLQS